MLSVYPACIYKEKEGNYSIIFPDLNHLATCGDNLNQAMEMAVDCLAGYLYEAKLNHEPLPNPSDIKHIDVDSEYSEYEEAFVNMIAVDVEAYAKLNFTKSVKKTLTIPRWLNDIAVSKKVNFSKTLQNALIDELDIDISQLNKA